jgi:polysaccharide biosynthesis protein PslH
MSARPRLLFLCHTLPYPLDSGLAIRSYHVLRLLARAFDTTALCLAPRKGGEDVPARVASLRQIADVEAFPVPQEHSVWRLAWDHVRSIARARVYTAFAHDCAALAARLAHLRRTQHFDLIHVDSIKLSRYLPRLLRDGARLICNHHNVESVLLERRAGVERIPWRRAYLRYQARLMASEERRWAPRCALNILVSEADRVALERIAPGARCAVVPNGVDIETFRPSPPSPPSPDGDEGGGLVFVGESTWAPNRDGWQYFCEEILPHIRAAGVTGPIRWVGRASDALRREYRDRYAVELTGYVTDIRPYVRDAACYVVPLRVGGGTRLKILDAWAMGKAVVSTSVGCEGLAVEDDRNILVRDHPAAFAQAVSAVLHDATLRRRLGAEGRRTVERLYSWNRVGESLVSLYASLCGDATGQTLQTRATDIPRAALQVIGGGRPARS